MPEVLVQVLIPTAAAPPPTCSGPLHLITGTVTLGLSSLPNQRMVGGGQCVFVQPRDTPLLCFMTQHIETPSLVTARSGEQKQPQDGTTRQ